ncbi:conserved protein, unknown function [Plasmodium sp. gorilla clade G2]|uniref:conserved protein, unknown function n=1 Tax=Plasmodium sp. gorilla clade G2 TaxID=880535 RepID=UPI000D20973E|nr:conserved protein, unknown function [Plasmodium sp. gorilla clade G2]SOV16594.1 conserved protein, unknown function [Plasmodium sp. gorilla clade G2]
MLNKLLPNIYKCKNLIEGKNLLLHFQYKRNYEANITKRSIRKLLHFFYKQVHPDLTSTLPEELKKKNSESLSVLNSYIDILSTEKNEENIFIERNIVFFKVFENKENKIIQGRYKHLVIKLHTLSNNLTENEKEKIIVKLIYDIKQAIGADEEKGKDNINHDDYNMSFDDNIYDKKYDREEKKDINLLWDKLTNHVKDTQALYQLSDEQVELINQRKNYFYYIKKKLLEKYGRIRHKKRRKLKIENIKQVANKIVLTKFPDVHQKYIKNNFDDINNYHQSYQIIQNGYDPSLLFFHKDLKEHNKIIALQNICGLNLKDDADKWLLESCLKLLKNHPIQIPIVICDEQKEIALSSTFGYIYVPFNFCFHDLFIFLQNNLDQARAIRKKILNTLDISF